MLRVYLAMAIAVFTIGAIVFGQVGRTDSGLWFTVLANNFLENF